MRSKDYLRAVLGIIALLSLMMVSYGQNNGGGKGGGGGTTPPAPGNGMTATLAMSQPIIESGGAEVVLAVVKNTGSSSASFKIDTALFAPDSNSGAMEEQTNTISLNPGQSFTQTMSVTPGAAGEYSVVSTFSVNGSVADVKTGAFQVVQF